MNLTDRKSLKKITAGSTLALLFTTFICGHFAMADKPSATDMSDVKSGVYCIDSGQKEFKVLAVQHNDDGTLDVGMMAWRDDGEFSFYGAAEPVRDHDKVLEGRWLLKLDMDSKDPNDHCAVDIVRNEHGWTASTRPEAACVSRKGHDVLDINSVSFPPLTYAHPVTVELTNADTLQNIKSCTEPPVVTPSFPAP